MPKHRVCKSGGWHFVVAAMVAFFTLAVVEPVAYSARPAEAQSGVIREIRVVGNRRVEPETVRTYLRFNAGDAYDAGKVDESIRSLFATGLFSDVRIDREGAGVVITVVENPVVNQVAFEGNREVDKATLTNEVQLKPRSIFTRAKAQADVQRILDVYRRQGRFAASVEPKIIELDSNRVNVVFEINEGTATKVQAINIIGNKAFSDSQLRDIITTTQSGWFDFLKGTNVYDPDRLALDRELLRQYYLKNGYADVRITSAGAELARDGSGFNITYVVDEGELFTFGKVDIESSYANVDPKSLYGELLTTPGATFDQSAMDRTVERLTLVVSEQGFAFARVRPRAAREPGTRAINVTYVIDQGPRIYIERINVNGNLRTLDYVVRREFRLAEGDAYNPLLVDRAKKRLQSLGFFKAVDIKRRPGTAPDRVVLDVDLVEQSTGELSFGAGYSTSEGVIGDVSITERNLLGKGQFLRLRLAGSAERLQVDLSFTEPRFLDRNLAAGFDLFHKEIDFSSTQQFVSRNNRWLGAARLPAFGEPVADQQLYALQQRALRRQPGTASLAIKQAPEGEYITSSWGTSLAYDTRNHPKNPTKGVYFQIGSDSGRSRRRRAVRPGAGRGTRSTTRSPRRSRWWDGRWPVTSRAGAARTCACSISSTRAARPFAASTGPASVRATCITGDALGGSTYWAATTEVRFPLPFIPDDLGMSGAVFADVGSVFGAGAGAKELQRRAAASRPRSALPTTPRSAPRSAAASSGTRRSGRCASISPRRSSSRTSTKSS